MKNRKLYRNDQAQEALRNRIVDGEFAPGSRLPTQRELSEEMGLSPVTLHKATRQLTREGFLCPMGSKGTFVSENPPHLCRYAMAFPSRPDGPGGWTNWWTVLKQAAQTIAQAEPQKQITPYYDITGHEDVEDYQRLLADAGARRLAGIILLVGPTFLGNTPLFEDCPVPRAYIGCDLWKWNIPGVAMDPKSFMDRAMGHVAGQSRRRPMLLGLNPDSDFLWLLWSGACRQYGIEPARWQILSLPLGPREAARHLVQVLMMLPPERRPDALVVADDHLVEEVTAGLLASNLPESELPTIVAHCNFPSPPRALLPVTFLGYESVSVVRAAIDLLDTQRRGELHSRIDVINMMRRGEIPTGPNIIPAIFESERSTAGDQMPTEQSWGTRAAMAGRADPHRPFFAAEELK